MGWLGRLRGEGAEFCLKGQKPPRIEKGSHAGARPEGSAEQAGLLLGDMILALDDERIESYEDLAVALADKANTEVEVSLARAGERQKLSVQVGERPAKE